MFKKKKRKNVGANAMSSALEESTAKSASRNKEITFSKSSSASSSSSSSSSSANPAFSSSSNSASKRADALLQHSFESDKSTTLDRQQAAGDVSALAALEAKAVADGGGDSSNPNAKKRKLGPTRPGANVRSNVTFDFKPDICKDYKETGFCSFGDTCVFIHDRGEFTAPVAMDRAWEGYSKKAKKSKPVAQDIPFKCLICRKDFEDPIVTLCKHYFCEACALGHYRTTKRCFVCNADTQGVFNSAKKIIDEAQAARKTQEAAATDGDDANGEDSKQADGGDL